MVPPSKSHVSNGEESIAETTAGPVDGASPESVVDASRNASALLSPDPELEQPRSVFAAVRYDSGIDFVHEYLDADAEEGSRDDAVYDLLGPLALQLQLVADKADADAAAVAESALLLLEGEEA